MKIWILKEGEPLPCDENPRLMRVGILAEYLARRGHQVVWWSTTFIHGAKTYRCQEQRELDIRENETLILLHSRVAYKKNTSLNRIRYNRILAQEFARNCEKYERPDLILCSYPTVEFAEKAISYGRKNHVPVILDVRDYWPDIFTRVFPAKLDWLVKIGILPMALQAKHAFRRANAITGVVPSALRWGLEKAGREQNLFDRTIYIGYKPDIWQDEEERRAVLMRWQNCGITPDTWNICFFGTMSSSSLDIDTCIEAVTELSNQYPDIRLVLCGDGDALKRYKKIANGNKCIVFPGWVGKTQIQSILEISKAGIYPYRNLWDFKNSYSNKIIGYMAEGLPVLSSLEGFSEQYIEKYDIGINYKEGDVSSCREAIETLYCDEKDRQNKGHNSYQRFKTDFDAEVVNRQFESLMEEILRSH
ncbi:MAG: glycosyltransferase family 4 protein [Lachnospiraceae bacterium]|nr:glycosyltransferase family 4 protein [Lachnospiraceae bacterium]